MSADDRTFKIIELKKQLKQQEEIGEINKSLRTIKAMLDVRIGCDIQGRKPALTADETDYYLPFPSQKAFHLFLRRMEELLESAEYQQKVWRGQRKLSRYWTATGHPAIDYFQRNLGVTFKVIEKEPGHDRIEHFSQGPFIHLADHPGRPDQDDIDDITDDDVIGFDSQKELDLFLNYAGTIIDAAIRQESSRIPLRYNILSRNKKIHEKAPEHPPADKGAGHKDPSPLLAAIHTCPSYSATMAGRNALSHRTSLSLQL